MDLNKLEIGQVVFALWIDDGYYYPGEVLEVGESKLNIQFHEDGRAWVDFSEVVDVDYALANFQVQGNWKRLGNYYSCHIISNANEPLKVRYDDGFTENVNLPQLRITKVSEKNTNIVSPGDCQESLKASKKSKPVGFIAFVAIAIVAVALFRFASSNNAEYEEAIAEYTTVASELTELVAVDADEQGNDIEYELVAIEYNVIEPEPTDMASANDELGSEYRRFATSTLANITSQLNFFAENNLRLGSDPELVSEDEWQANTMFHVSTIQQLARNVLNFASYEVPLEYLDAHEYFYLLAGSLLQSMEYYLYGLNNLDGAALVRAAELQREVVNYAGLATEAMQQSNEVFQVFDYSVLIQLTEVAPSETLESIYEALPEVEPVPSSEQEEVGFIISAPSQARRNEVLTITFQGLPNTTYSLRIVSAAGNTLTADGLGATTSDANGIASWTWLVGGRTGAGTQRATITGGGQTIRHDILIIVD